MSYSLRPFRVMRTNAIVPVKCVRSMATYSKRSTPISRVRDIDSFIDLIPPVSIKAFKPTSVSSSCETFSVSIQALRPTTFNLSLNSNLGTHQFQLKPLNVSSFIYIFKPISFNSSLESLLFQFKP